MTAAASGSAEGDRRARARDGLVRVVERRGISASRVLEAIREVPRHRFVPDELADAAYEDRPLRIGRGQVVTQPSLVARMVEESRIPSDARVLEIGTGSGYGAAVLSRMARRVYTVERFSDFVDSARARFRELGYGNVTVRQGDGTLGWEAHAPFAAIVCTAGSPPQVPAPLRQQLREGGRLVIPVGARPTAQHLFAYTRRGPDRFDEEPLIGVRFVPLVGQEGWSADEV